MFSKSSDYELSQLCILDWGRYVKFGEIALVCIGWMLWLDWQPASSTPWSTSGSAMHGGNVLRRSRSYWLMPAGKRYSTLCLCQRASRARVLGLGSRAATYDGAAGVPPTTRVLCRPYAHHCEAPMRHLVRKAARDAEVESWPRLLSRKSFRTAAFFNRRRDSGHCDGKPDAVDCHDYCPGLQPMTMTTSSRLGQSASASVTSTAATMNGDACGALKSNRILDALIEV